MDDSWRIKRYYGPRVLIALADILDSPFPDSLLCLTGPELGILRNLLQYAHRRSTWVSEYRDNDYLAPTDDEWNEVEAIVADLEEKLMGCAEMFETFADMVAALQCLCTQLSALSSASPIPVDSVIEGQPIYDEYVSSVIEDVGDPPEGFDTWDDWRDYKCIGAQKIVDDLIAAMERIGAATGGGILVSYALVQAALAGLVVLPPLALVLLIASLLAVSGLSYIQSEARAWVAAHKEGLVCAIWGAEDATTARADVWAYLDDEWDVIGDPQFVKMLFSNWLLANLFDGWLAGYDEWSGDYSADYCGVCDLPVLPYNILWNFPPCPGDWTGTPGCWDLGGGARLGVNGGDNLNGISPSWYWPAPQTLDVGLYSNWSSKFNAGVTVGYMQLERSLDGITGWTLVQSLTHTTLVPAGVGQVLDVEYEDVSIPASYYRIRYSGQVGQGDANPFPLMVQTARCRFKTPD